jgi:hypothetical protein
VPAAGGHHHHHPSSHRQRTDWSDYSSRNPSLIHQETGETERERERRGKRERGRKGGHHSHCHTITVIQASALAYAPLKGEENGLVVMRATEAAQRNGPRQGRVVEEIARRRTVTSSTAVLLSLPLVAYLHSSITTPSSLSPLATDRQSAIMVDRGVLSDSSYPLPYVDASLKSFVATKDPTLLEPSYSPNSWTVICGRGKPEGAARERQEQTGTGSRVDSSLVLTYPVCAHARTRTQNHFVVPSSSDDVSFYVSFPVSAGKECYNHCKSARSFDRSIGYSPRRPRAGRISHGISTPPSPSHLAHVLIACCLPA